LFGLGVVVLALYLGLRFPTDTTAQHWSLLALGLFPTTFFFRAAYSEALFLLLIVLVLYGLERRWPYLLIALIIAWQTATRAVGVVLVARCSFIFWQPAAELRSGIAWLCSVLPTLRLGPGCLRRVSMGAIR